MAKAAGQGQEKLRSISRPPDSSGHSTVQVPYSGSTPMSSTGFLCYASGALDFSTYGDVFRVVGAYFVITNETTPNGSVDGYWIWQHNPTFYSGASSPLNWNENGNLHAFCTAAGGNGKNVLYVVGIYYDAMNVAHFTAVETVAFTGDPCKTCPQLETGAAAEATEAVAAAAAVAAGAPAPNLVGPSDKDGDWLLYRLSASNDGDGSGNILMRHGQPLKASAIAVAAANVNWQHGLTKATVRRALGDHIPGGNFYRFPGLPANGIVISQPQGIFQAFPVNRAVASECREHPDYHHLNRNLGIAVQVNFQFADLLLRNGTFELWVKVID